MVLNYRMIGRVSGMILLILGIAMVPCVLISLFYDETSTAVSFVYSIVVMLSLGLAAQKIPISPKKPTLRDAYIIVALCWILGSMLGAVPYVVSGSIPNYIDALFESVSGLTATGATLLSDVESLPRGMLFWRSLTQWLGGMGILVFAIAILPALGIGMQQLMKAETPGPVLDKLTPKIADTAKILYMIYISMTLLEFSLLSIGGLSPYDAILHTFGTVSSGGFSNYNDGIRHFGSIYIETVTFLFMIAVGMSFHVFFSIVKGKWNAFIEDAEIRLYLIIIGIAAIALSLNLFLSGTYDSVSDAIRFGFFQAATSSSTTAYLSAEAYLWTDFSKMLLFALMFIGGCSASTAGAIKVIRFLVIAKLVQRGFLVRLHHRAILPIKINGRRLPSDTVNSITGFMILYFVLFAAGALLISLDNHGLLISATASAAALGNGGCCFDLIDPNMNFSIFSAPSKILLSFLMLAGRLELFTIILLLTPSFWNPDH